MTGMPHEFEAADALTYHNQAVGIVEKLNIGELDSFKAMFGSGVSDSGFPIWLSVIYFFTSNSLFAARIVNALMGTWMCVFIYKLARRNFGEGAARISAILAMLLPTFIYYSGIHNKETVMAFLLVAFAERADYFLLLSIFKQNMESPVCSSFRKFFVFFLYRISCCCMVCFVQCLTFLC